MLCKQENNTWNSFSLVPRLVRASQFASIDSQLCLSVFSLFLVHLMNVQDEGQLCFSGTECSRKVFHHSQCKVQDEVPQLLDDGESHQEDSPDGDSNDDVVHLVPAL